jgi:hypothetical protein
LDVNAACNYSADADTGTPNVVTPLCVACENGHLGVVQLLVAYGADVNTPNTGDGYTPLHAAGDRVLLTSAGSFWDRGVIEWQHSNHFARAAALKYAA